MGVDKANAMTLMVWTNLPVTLDNRQTANTLAVKVVDQITSSRHWHPTRARRSRRVANRGEPVVWSGAAEHPGDIGVDELEQAPLRADGGRRAD
jgi:hypothetical protein